MINPQLNEQQNNITGQDAYYNKEDVDPNAIYLAGGSSLQTPEEFEQDKKGDHSKEDNSITASGGVDDLQSNSDGAAGTDRAGTTERKDYGDTDLNKGLESQAKDGESI